MVEPRDILEMSKLSRAHNPRLHNIVSPTYTTLCMTANTSVETISFFWQQWTMEEVIGESLLDKFFREIMNIFDQ